MALYLTTLYYVIAFQERIQTDYLDFCNSPTMHYVNQTTLKILPFSPHTNSPSHPQHRIKSHIPIKTIKHAIIILILIPFFSITPQHLHHLHAALDQNSSACHKSRNIMIQICDMRSYISQRATTPSAQPSSQSPRVILAPSLAVTADTPSSREPRRRHMSGRHSMLMSQSTWQRGGSAG